MKWQYYYLFLGAFVHGILLFVGILLQMELFAFVSCLTFLMYIIVFFVFAPKHEEKRKYLD